MTIDHRECFRRYVEDRRTLDLDGFDRRSFEHLVRYTAIPPLDEGFILYASLTPGREMDEIREQIAHFRALGQGFEWKVHDFDRPDDLRSRLAAEGFVSGDEETFMMLALADAQRPDPRKETADVVRVVDASGIADVMAIQREVWREDFEWMRLSLESRLRDAPDTLSIYCVYRDGGPVGSGWLDFIPGSAYPDLHGGAVVERARGLGIYRALFDVRLAESARRGYEFLCVDASPNSRPILQHAGFQPICTTVPMRMRLR